jgi:hypothetical protein
MVAAPENACGSKLKPATTPIFLQPDIWLQNAFLAQNYQISLIS